jgi:hypothetical protein
LADIARNTPELRLRIADVLGMRDTKLKKDYIKFLIHELHDDTKKLHTSLLEIYLQEHELEVEEKGESRRSITSFLELSGHYDHEKLLEMLPESTPLLSICAINVRLVFGEADRFEKVGEI